MNIFKRAWKAVKRNLSIGDWDKYLDANISGGATYGGMMIDKDIAMNYSAFFSGVMQISQTIASLPLMPYRLISDTSNTVVKNHPLFKLFKTNTNAHTAAFNWKELTVHHLILWGNSYSYIQRNGADQVIALYQMNPEYVKVRVQYDGSILYEFKPKNGTKKIYKQHEILHVAGFGYDGVMGYSVLKLARQTIGLGLTYEQFIHKFIKNGAFIGGVLQTDKVLSKEAKHNLRESWKKKYSGSANAGEIPLLEEGLKFEQTIMPLEDAQFLESRVFNISEIARWLNMPPHKLKELSNATYDNITSEQISWLQDTIRPWLERIESAMDFQLLNKREQENMYMEFNANAILRTDIKTRFEAYNMARNAGVLSANEWRARENMQPIEGDYGDEYLVPLNMVPASELYMEPVAEPTEPEPTEPEPEPEDDNTEPEENMFNRPVEKRAKAGATLRKKTARRYKPIMKDVLQTIVNKETKDIRKIVDKVFNSRVNMTLETELDNYYERFAAYFRNAWRPIFSLFASDIIELSGSEINEKTDINDYQDKISSFIDNTVNRHIVSSKGQIKNVTTDNPGEEAEAIDVRMTEWEDRRPDKESHRESVDGDSGLAQIVFFSYSWRTMWLAVGKSCPYCMGLDGRIVSSGESYAQPGDRLEADGKPPIIVGHTLSHPSAHQGCDCTVIAV